MLNYEQERHVQTSCVIATLIEPASSAADAEGLSSHTLPQVPIHQVIVTDLAEQAVIIESHAISVGGNDARREPSFGSALLATLTGLGGVAFCHAPMWAAAICGIRPGCEVFAGAIIGIGCLIGLAPMALVHYGFQWMLYRACQAADRAYAGFCGRPAD